MTSMLLEAYDYFYAKLKLQAALSSMPVVVGEARPGTTGKWVVQQRQGGTDNTALGGFRNYSEYLILVRAVMQTESYADLATEAAAIDTALQGLKEERTGSGLAFVHIVTREQEWDQPETEGTVEYRSLGGIYRIQLQPV